ncbi:F-box only protein 13 [Canna indica]|uniref:F-box only protein 13 n=1 Tax=Canna indica TaxID=4628 RepID=A0AAQ3PZG1_9LILI|nr:F-box only protein 13 [Canna indica]
MEHRMAPGETRKRKATEDAHSSLFSLDELNQDMLERVLSCLPAASFFRLRSVCKRWRSIASSATFRMLCSQIPSRDPWFLMVDQELEHSVAFDTSEGNWKSRLPPIQSQEGQSSKFIPVAASGGLVCYRTVSGGLSICNPVTGACRLLPQAVQDGESLPLHVIAMNSFPRGSSSYKIVLVSGELPNLAFRVFDSSKSTWGWDDEVKLVHKIESSSESRTFGDGIVYFLSKTGDVVATNMQRSPSKQFSSVLTMENGEEIVYFISQSGSIVACNLSQKTFVEYPRLLPIYLDYSIDVVECSGEVFVVVLSEFLETASLRVWKFHKEARSWQQVAAMPPWMSHEFYGKKVDINCAGWGNMILICASSKQFSSCVMFNMEANEWVELPECSVNGKSKKFMSAFSFEPRLEAAA